MNEKQDFDKLVDAAMADTNLSAMRQVVEKELLHYEIFHALDGAGLLKDLVFQGGTSLRLCRGSDRYSEDLDFAGGVGFSAAKMGKIADCVRERIGERFGLNVAVSAKPAKAGEGRVKVDKWWIAIETSPANPAMPKQKIKLEIANIPAHTRELRPVLANYDSARAMSTVYVNAETLDEIMADKVLAFPTSLLDNKGSSVEPGSAKIRHRDIWDLAWLVQKGAKLDPKLVAAKIGDYGVVGYGEMLDQALARIPSIVQGREFKQQMGRFIGKAALAKTLDVPGHLEYMATTVHGLFSEMRAELGPAIAEAEAKAKARKRDLGPSM
jgi:hypothetical protein